MQILVIKRPNGRIADLVEFPEDADPLAIVRAWTGKYGLEPANASKYKTEVHRLNPFSSIMQLEVPFSADGQGEFI